MCHVWYGLLFIFWTPATSFKRTLGLNLVLLRLQIFIRNINFGNVKYMHVFDHDGIARRHLQNLIIRNSLDLFNAKYISKWIKKILKAFRCQQMKKVYVRVTYANIVHLYCWKTPFTKIIVQSTKAVVWVQSRVKVYIRIERSLQ